MNLKIAMLRVTMMVILHCASTTEIRKNSEPYMYKALSVGRPVIFPDEMPTFESVEKKKMKMMFGCAPEDIEIDLNNVVRRNSPSQFVSLRSSTPIEETGNAIDEMMEVIVNTEGEEVAHNDPLMNELIEVAEAINSTMETVNTRTATAGGSDESAGVFIDKVKKLLAASGIEAVLPLDCGRNPLSLSDPLGEEPLPWVAALGSREDGRFHYRCTGVIISQFHIITDAECVTSPNINVAQLNVTGLVPEPFAIENFVVGRRIHPSVKGTENLLEGENIGILELARPLEFNDYVQPICLPGVFDKQDPDEIDFATIIGFDNINDTPRGRIAGLYTWPSSKTFGAAACYTAVKRFNKENPDETSMLFTIITKNHMCVDRPFEEVGKSVVVKEDPVTGRVQLLGVGGVANARKTNPIAYTLVQPHRFWIELVLKKFRDNTA